MLKDIPSKAALSAFQPFNSSNLKTACGLCFRSPEIFKTAN